jgi:hypothetical protein
MSRNTLCLLTATILAGVAVASMVFRYHVLGDEIHSPTGPGIWKVTLVVEGQMEGPAKLAHLTPLDTAHQRLLRESAHSEQFTDHGPDPRRLDRHPERRYMNWSKRSATSDGPFRVSYVFFCATEDHHSTGAVIGKDMHAAPQHGEFLEATSASALENEHIAAEARRLTDSSSSHAEQTEALFDFVSRHIRHEPSVHEGDSGSAADCLDSISGDSRAQARLLVALLRSRGIPARVVTGIRLIQDDGQLAHYWVEAWLHDHWLPMCPFYHHFGRIPTSYLVFAFGDLPVVHGKHVSNLDYALLAEKTSSQDAFGGPEPSKLKTVLRSLRLTILPQADQKLVEFLLLLPLAALIICIFRNVIGVYSFGTFAPALVGLAFRDLKTLPGMLVFASILLIGWLLRRLLDRYNLLQVPRIAFMLSTIVVLLILLIVAANSQSLAATTYIPLFPMVILTGMIERFWTLETEDGASASFKTLFTTMFISAVIALVLGIPWLVEQMKALPEILGLIMAAQLLLGRYTGYRLTELIRFRDFLHPTPALHLDDA